MNKLLSFTIALLLTSTISQTVQASPTRFLSPNYGVESVIFGGTGVLRSSDASIPPVILTGPVVTAITTSTAAVSWTTDKPSNSVIVFGTVSGSYTFQTEQVGGTTFTSHLINLTQLQKATTYYYIVKSSDVAGNLTQSTEHSFVSDPGDITPPVVTSGPTIANNSATSITVTWQTDKLSSTTVEYGLIAVDENALGRADDLTLFHQVTITGLLSAQKYLLRIKSKDASGNLYIGPTQTIQTLNAPTITGVTISNITLDSALIQWETSSQSTTVVSYGVSSSYGQVSQDVGTFSQHHLVRLSGLLNGTVYYLRISGQDQTGNKIQSDEYNFKTVILPVISKFQVSNITADQALLTWTSSSDIDELLRGTITKAIDPKLKGKKISGGNDKLVSQHSYVLTDLDSETEYTLSVIGKDVFGNQAVSSNLVFSTLVDRVPPVIENIKSDTSVDLGSKQTVQVLVSFGINKLAKSIIEYGSNASGSYDQKVLTDTEYSQNKFLVIPGLQPGLTYHFHIIATDRSGNTATSADYLVLAPNQPVSLLDLIFGRVQSNFGWLSRL